MPTLRAKVRGLIDAGCEDVVAACPEVLPRAVRDAVKKVKWRRRNPAGVAKPREGAGNRMMDRLRGDSFRHPQGYVPVYPGITDLAAFQEGQAAAGRRGMPSANPYAAASRKGASWLDGLCYGMATLSCPPGPAAWTRTVLRARSIPFERGVQRGRRAAG